MNEQERLTRLLSIFDIEVFSNLLFSLSTSMEAIDPFDASSFSPDNIEAVLIYADKLRHAYELHLHYSEILHEQIYFDYLEGVPSE